MKYIYLYVAAILLFIQPTQSRGQGCDTIFLAPDSVQLITDSSVNAYVRIGDTMYIAGEFHAVGKPTGSFSGISKQSTAPVQQALWPKITGKVNFALKDGHGGWIVGGYFQRVGDSLRNNLVWIDSSAQVRAWHPNVSGEIFCGVLKDSVLYIGGDFTAVNDSSRTMLAGIKLDAAATLLPLNIAVDDKINAMALWNNTLWIGGSFNQVGNMTRNKLAAVDLSSNSPTNEITNLNATASVVNALIISDTNLYVGGAFSKIQTQQNGPFTVRQSALCLNAQTGVLTPWVCDLSSDVYNDQTVFSFDTIGSNIVLAGSFAAINGITRTSIGLVDKISGQVQPFNGSIMESKLAPALTLCHDDSLLYVGNVQYAKGTNTVSIIGEKVYGIAAFNIFTSELSNFKPVIAPVITENDLLYSFINPYKVTTLVNDGANLYIGGQCKFIGGKIRNRLAAFVMSSGQLTSFSSNLFNDNDTYFNHYNKMGIINNMTSSNGRLFLSGQKNNNVPDGSPILACNIQTGSALIFPDSNWVAHTPDKCYSIMNYNGYIYADVETLNGSFVWRIDTSTLVRDQSWSIEYPFGTMYPGPIRILNFRNNIGYIEMNDVNNYNFYLFPYNLNTGISLNVEPITVPILISMWNHQVNHLGFIGDKAILTGNFDRIQSPYPGQHIQYSIGMVSIDSNNEFSPVDHPLDEYNNQPPAAAPNAPIYESLETYGNRIYSMRYDISGISNVELLSPRIYDTAGNRIFPQWNPDLNILTNNLVPFNKDTVVIFDMGQVLNNRPYYGMARFHLGQNSPSIHISANPGSQVVAGTIVTFSTQINNSSPTASIRWYRNNLQITNASGPTWQGIAGIDFTDNDSISARMTGPNACIFAGDTVISNNIAMDVTPLSLKETNVPEAFSIFPNPTTETLTVKGIEENTQLEIFGISGKNEKEMTLTPQIRNSINIKNLPSGNYLFKFIKNSGQYWLVKISKL